MVDTRRAIATRVRAAGIKARPVTGVPLRNRDAARANASRKRNKISCSQAQSRAGKPAHARKF
eukprot:2146949-Lingulodinium_polyedra.AAC.1